MNIVKVETLKGIDTTKYKEGTLFTTPKQMGMIHQGVVEELLFKKEIMALIKKEVKRGLKNDK